MLAWSSEKQVPHRLGTEKEHDVRLTIGKQLISAFVFVTALILFSAIIGSVAAVNMQRRAKQVVDEAFPAVVACESLRSALNHSFAALRGFIVLGADPQEADRFETERVEAWIEVDLAMSELTRLDHVWTARQDQQQLAAIRTNVSRLRELQEAAKTKAHADDNIPAVYQLRENVEPLALEMDQLLTEVIAEEGTLEATSRRKEFLRVISDTRGALAVALTTLRAYVVSGDEALGKRFDDEWRTYREAYGAAFRVLRRMTATQQAHWERFDELHSQLTPQPQQILELRSGERWNESHYILKSEAVPLAIQIRQHVTQLQKSGKSRVAKDQSALEAASWTLLWTLISVAAFTVLVGGAGTFSMGRKVVGTIQQAVETVASTSRQMSETAESQKQTAHQQVLAVSELTATMEELSRSAESSTQQANQALDRSRHVLQLASNGTEIVDQSVDGMSTITARVNDVAEQIVQLSEHNGQIREMTSLVRDLAKRTNVLALNASVEAAQAGEQGFGFAVVAGEIRKLAEESASSAKHIQNLVTQIESSTNSTVMATEEGTKTLKTGTELAERTTSAFHHVADSIDGAVEGIQQISLNAKEQADAINHIGSAMSEISQGVHESEQNAIHSQLAVGQLSEAVSNLQAIV